MLSDACTTRRNTGSLIVDIPGCIGRALGLSFGQWYLQPDSAKSDCSTGSPAHEILWDRERRSTGWVVHYIRWQCVTGIASHDEVVLSQMNGAGWSHVVPQL